MSSSVQPSSCMTGLPRTAAKKERRRQRRRQRLRRRQHQQQTSSIARLSCAAAVTMAAFLLGGELSPPGSFASTPSIRRRDSLLYNELAPSTATADERPIPRASLSEPDSQAAEVATSTQQEQRGRRWQRLRSELNPQNDARSRSGEARELLAASTTTMPFLPSYPDNTCNNNRKAETWETPHTSLSSCCSAYFAWDSNGCIEIYHKLGFDKENDDSDADETKDDEEEGEGIIPYAPNRDDKTCYNDKPPKAQQVTYNSLKKCCGSNFNHIMSQCMTLGKEAEANKDKPFLPDWGNHVCSQSREKQGAWEEGFKTLDKCCRAHFDWNLNVCLGIETVDDIGENNDDDEVVDESDDAWDGGRTEVIIWWHPIKKKGRCVTDIDKAPPTYMQNDPEAHMFKTYKECCKSNFPEPNDYDECLDDSGARAPPTRPPALNSNGNGGGDMTAIKGTKYDAYYYPKYTESKCLLNGNTAPKYMKKDPITYFTLSAGECCREHFPTERKECVRDSPKAPDGSDEEDDQVQGGGLNGVVEAVSPARFKYHFYPTFAKVACIKNINIDAPQFMYESTDDFFFLDVDLCCSVSFELEYAQCVKNSKLLELELPLDDRYNDGDDNEDGPKEPRILIKFGGKLYFRNVFIPSSTPANMRIVRDAVLNSIEVALEGYRVREIVGLNFDGVEISELDEYLAGTRARSLSEGSSSTSSVPRRLARMQLFLFDMSITLPCDRACAGDITSAGRSASMVIASLFETSITNGGLFRTLSSDMEGMGLVGPFFSATLEEGYLQYQSVQWDGLYTFTPTISPRPTPGPTREPITPGPPTRKPTRRPTFTPTDNPTKAHPYYPNFDKGTCVNDGKQSEFQLNLYDSLEECCKFPWLIEAECRQKGGLSGDTTKKTPKPTPKPNTPYPTPSPVTQQGSTTTDPPETLKPSSKPPSAKPSKNPTVKPTPLDHNMSEWPTFSPTTYEPTTPPPTSSPTTSEPTTVEPTTAALTCSEYGWHLNAKTNDGCTNDSNYADAWLHANIKSKMFHTTAKACCDTFFVNQKCDIYEVDGCDEKEPTTVGEGCTEHGWHVDRKHNDGCTNDDNIVKSWLENPALMENVFQPTSKACCDKFFANKPCKIYDCKDAPPPSSSSCVGYGWHIDNRRNDGCTDDENYLESWLHPNIKDKMFHPTSQACCDHYFKGKNCEVYDKGCVIKEPGATTPPPSPVQPATASCSGHGWHIQSQNNDGCSDGTDYVDAWLLNPGLKEKMFLSTSQACCNEHYPNRECKVYPSVCPPAPGPPPPAPEPSTPAVSPPSCISQGWHVERTHQDGCSDDDNFVEVWLTNPSLKERMFLPTSEACCNQFFPGEDCKVYDSDCVMEGSPAPEPTPPAVSPPPSASCVSHGWHVKKTGSDGCSDDDDYEEAWLSNPALKDNYFFTTADMCCQKFFPTKDCKIYPSVCPPAGAIPPTPPPPVAGPPTLVNSALFEGFEGGDLSATKFTTDATSLPWTITDEFAYGDGSTKSVKNSLTSRGQSSKLTLAENFPTDGRLVYALRHDVFMPWALLQVTLDDELVAGFPGHNGDPKWEMQTVSGITKGFHTIVWEVLTKDIMVPPTQKGTSTVWVDNVQFIGTVTLDFEDQAFDDDLFSFSGIGKWSIDSTLPGPPSAQKGMSVHSPKGLLPGEHSTMKIDWTSTSGGMISFDCHLGLGKISFFVDDNLRFSLDQPGKGTQKVDAAISPGDHTFSWKYEPPQHANLPMSMVWLDNIMLTL